MCPQKNEQKVAPLPKVTSVEEIWKKWQQLMLHFTSYKDCAPAVLQMLTADCIKQVMEESPESPARDLVLRTLQHHEDLHFAGQFIFDHCKKKTERTACFQIIGKAAPEQLADFREKSEGMLLSGIAPKKLLGFFGGVQPDDDGIENAA